MKKVLLALMAWASLITRILIEHLGLRFFSGSDIEELVSVLGGLKEAVVSYLSTE